MKIKAYQSFKKRYRKLPADVQGKVDKQIEHLSNNFRNPSLHTKKIKGKNDIWEVGVDDFYRLTFEIIDNTIFLRVVGAIQKASMRRGPFSASSRKPKTMRSSHL